MSRYKKGEKILVEMKTMAGTSLDERIYIRDGLDGGVVVVASEYEKEYLAGEWYGVSCFKNHRAIAEATE